MAVRKAKRLAISAALLAPQLASARVPSRVEAGALIPDANGQSAIPSSTWRLAPAAGYRGSRGSIAGATSAWIDNQNWQLVDGSIGGTLVGPTIYGVRAELIGNASRAFDERSLGSDQVDVQTRINIQFNKTSGAWLGGGVAPPASGAGGSSGPHQHSVQQNVGREARRRSRAPVARQRGIVGRSLQRWRLDRS